MILALGSYTELILVLTPDNHKLIKLLKSDPYVQAPEIPEVRDVIKNIPVTNLRRGNPKPQQQLRHLEQLYRDRIAPHCDLSAFEHCYIVAGVTDAITQFVATERNCWQITRGDYEYALSISNRGLIHDEPHNRFKLLMSNPYCGTGNIVGFPVIDQSIVCDMAYAGSTPELNIELPDNCEQAWFSFSKSHGLVGERIGLVFTKQPHPSLSLSQGVGMWNYTSVDIAIRCLEKFSYCEIPQKYLTTQQQICDALGFTASDCFFIATTHNPEFDCRKRAPDLPARINLSHCWRYI